jgi:ribonuclease HII
MLKAFYKPGIIEAGCDEAGRGCLAGPVVAAAVILPAGFKNNHLNDSKQLNEKKRNELRKIIEQEAVSYAVDMLTHTEIDEINILNASFIAMHKAVDKLCEKPELLLIDGNRFIAYNGVKHVCIVKGDAKFMNIAAASVLAKTWRDEFMMKIHNEFPVYNWNKNKGYPTQQHREAIVKHGISPYHRRSFQLLPSQLSLNL